MNISAELAAKVLDADLRNIVKKVSDGGTLSPSERAMLQNFALPEGAARARRIAALVTRYASGARLSAVELAEVRESHPDFAPGADPDAETPASTPPLTLTPDPAPSQGDHEVTAAQLRAWEIIYKTKHRQLRRWIARGLERGEPCPLDDPRAMPAWIEKHLEKIRGDLRDNVQAAADRAAPRAPSPSAESVQTAPPPTATLPLPSTSIDLATVGGVEGQSVALFRQLFAAAKIELINAYSGGNEDRKRTLHTRIEKIGESLRKHEAAAEVKAKRQGDLLEKAEVLNEVMQALNVMARIEEQRADLVAADVPELPPELAKKVRDSFLRSGEKARAMLRNLSVLRASTDVQLGLAA